MLAAGSSIAWAIREHTKALTGTQGGPSVEYVDLDRLMAEKALREEYDPNELVFDPGDLSVHPE